MYSRVNLSLQKEIKNYLAYKIAQSPFFCSNVWPLECMVILHERFRCTDSRQALSTGQQVFKIQLNKIFDELSTPIESSFEKNGIPEFL